MEPVYFDTVESFFKAPFTLILENEKMETVSKVVYLTFQEARANAVGFFTIKDSEGVRIEARW